MPHGVTLGDDPPGGPATLVVGELGFATTLNPLLASADDPWTQDVLGRVYDTVGKTEALTEALKPYIVKGIDADGDGAFEPGEYGVFSKAVMANQTNVTAYYDFNGVYFHDGVQANVGDLLFSYQLMGMNSRMNSAIRELMDRAGKSGSNYSVSRWLYVSLAPKVWVSEPSVGDHALRYAVRYQLQEPNVLFNRTTLAGCILFPRHVWEGTGWRQNGTSAVTNLHADFGRAIYPEMDARFGQGVPTSDTQHFVYVDTSTQQSDSAEEWAPAVEDVIGTGPFMLDNFDPVSGSALVIRNQDYYSGNDSKRGISIDPSIAAYIHPPHIGGVRFTRFTNPTRGILAFGSGSIDYLHWQIAPEFVPSLQTSTSITVWTSPDPSFTYLGYNMRNLGVGVYNYGQPNQVDTGLHFRKAIAHLIDKATIVNRYLQGYGLPGVIPLNPDNSRFYNSSLTAYAFSEELARQEIRQAHNDSLALVTMVPDAVKWYTWEPDGKLYLPAKGTSQFQINCPEVDYDSTSANSCSLIASEMVKLGIQVVATPVPFNNLLSMVEAHAFDMYTLGWRVESNDPYYLYDLFHSSNAATGYNFGGFNDPPTDLILEQTRSESNESRRVALFKSAESVLLDELPIDTLYFRTNIEATRTTCFNGWVRDIGTIWNYWSLLNLTNTCINNPPVASFTVSPQSGSSTTVFSFDASASSDVEDPTSLLETRWDWENDGFWDTGWSTDKMAEHRFTADGTYIVSLEVRDTSQATDNTTRQVFVGSGIHTPEGLNYKPIVAAVFAIILAVAGVWSSRKRPWKGGKDGMAVAKSFMIFSLPFVLAEVATGVASFLTGGLRIPPLIGVGTFVDGAILAAGVAAAVFRISRPGGRIIQP